MVLTNLEKSERERSLQKTLVSRLEAKVDRHNTQPLSEVEVDHHSNQIVAVRVEVIETHRKILACSPLINEVYEDEFVDLLDKLDIMECALKTIKLTFPSSTLTSHTSACSSTGTKSEVRLPRLELPIFSGNLADWMSFHDMFMSTVHTNAKLSDAQKLTYLRSVLTDDAAKLIKSIPSTDANYNIAWNLLLERYQNERELFFSILNRFAHQPSSPGDSAALRSLLDVSKECIRSLEALNVQVQHWDGILVYIMAQKLDSTSRQFWELSLKNTKIPVLKEFLGFLEQRARALAAAEVTKSTPATKQSLAPRFASDQKGKITHSHHVRAAATCKFCSGAHLHFQCRKFLSLSVSQRKDEVKKHYLCFNCLRDGHSSAQCPSDKTCHTCKGKHHSLLHIDKSAGIIETRPSAGAQPPESVKSHHSNDDTSIIQTLLATALVKIKDHFGRFQVCRAFLDGGSTNSFVTESCVKRLGLSRKQTSTKVFGLASAPVGTAKGIISLHMCPNNDGPENYDIRSLILPKITGRLPSNPCDPTMWPHIIGLDYADPSFHTPGEIDILLGSDIFWNVLLEGKKTGSPSAPIAMRSTLGWLIAGNLDSISAQVKVHMTDVDLDERLKTFWELESIPTARALTKEENLCQNHFDTTHIRQLDGRFSVSLPFKNPRPYLGSSRDSAIRRLKSLERRLAGQPEMKNQYVKFMDEYLSLGHMTRITNEEVHGSSHPNYYIPHHYILKDASTTTKFRVVFDASAKTSSGLSLNETLLVGPTIQENLISILMRFRTHQVAFTADVAKMYRQITMTPPDSDMQRIVWRRNPSEPIQDFRLVTVTYGTSSAPYHAVRTLHQLATNEIDLLPLAAKVAMNDFYVDDVMSGGKNEEEALKIQSELLELMARGKFPLRKWSSNSSALLEALPLELRETQLPLRIDTDECVKTLGLYWNPGSDHFNFKVNLVPLVSENSVKSINTKRTLLSEMSKIFDPLGWLAPIIIRVKILFQQLWSLNLKWDDPLPYDVQQQWNSYKFNLPLIETICIPRCIVPSRSTRLSIHGFCDASEQAFAAVVYLKADQSTKSIISIVTSKTRVAPTKKISLPRLELCGATLLAQLIRAVQKALKLNIDQVYAWTDSTVVLAWLAAHPSRWKTFIANRVTEIQDTVPFDHWGHVRGIDNPADCPSRGIEPSELQYHSLWWKGPTWLQDCDIPPLLQNPTEESEAALLEERKIIVVSHANVLTDVSLFQRFSTLKMLKSVTAWWYRFRNNCQRTKTRQTGPLTVEELESALIHWIRVAQSQLFELEIKCLKGNKALPSKSRILPLNPFLDSKSLLRVGGRLRHALIPEDQKRPILLPRHHHITTLIINHLHLQNFHAGPQLLLATLNRRYWVIGARDEIRRQLKKCITCTRHGAPISQTLMGDLPASRLTPSRPFFRCGVDYAGPFLLRAIPPRSKFTIKAYLSLFVCYATHALHLEVVSALTTNAFIAALKRFIGRRGLCGHIYSDNGTNFVGAARELKELYALTSSTSHNIQVAAHLSKSDIQWHFNPPSAPHFGGLWEAGVKSVKFHLNRILGSTRLTFEELTTTMIQIEACLNSRPLTPISSDPNDMSALTPGHFLVGGPLTAIPEPDYTVIKSGRLNRWQLTQQLVENFWKRWSQEFLSRLQQRPKWLKSQTEIQKNDMVIIKEELPPQQWKLGRVVETHPGNDGITRVVSVQTSSGIIKRPIVKLVLLPIDSARCTPEDGESL